MSRILPVIVFLGVFYFSPKHCIGQKRAANWVFGISAGLNFNCYPVDTVRAANKFYTYEGTATISDTDGQLLFYTNCDSVWNKKHKAMPNGFGIGQTPYCYGSSTQGALIVPVPDSKTLYYIFTTDCAENRLSKGLRYSIVDMSLQNGLGDVVVKNRLLLDSACEKLAGMVHGNGKDIWVVSHRFWRDEFYAYKVTSNGLDTVPVISKAGQVQSVTRSINYPECMGRGVLKFSPDGKKIIVLTFSDCHQYTLKPELFSFNDQTGKISLDYTIDDKDSFRYYHASFSPNGRYLYLSTAWSIVNLHQFDVGNATNSATFMASKKVILSNNTFLQPLATGMNLGPDGKLYISTNRSWMDVIHFPNKGDTFCRLQRKAVIMKKCPVEAYTYYSVPNFIESYFRDTFMGKPCKDSIDAKFDIKGLCVNDSFQFVDRSVSFSDPVRYWYWNFGDSASGSSNFYEGQNPKHKFTREGTYTIRLILSKNPLKEACNPVHASKVITVKACGDTTYIDQTICDGDSFSLNGKWFKNSGVYYEMLTDGSGGDSLIRLVLKVNLKSSKTFNQKICDGDSIKFGNKIYGKSGTFIDTLTSYYGCDSLLILHLDVIPVSKKDSIIRLCRSDSVYFDGKYRINGEKWSDTLSAYNSCDSILVFEIRRDSSSLCSCSDIRKWPNVFTPNGDSSNEFFPDEMTPGSLIEIYDRWGVPVFKSHEKGWNGKCNDSDAPSGTYFYFVSYKDCYGNSQSVHGVLSLIR